jgi:hypothetical protein
MKELKLAQNAAGCRANAHPPFVTKDLQKPALSIEFQTERIKLYG